MWSGFIKIRSFFFLILVVCLFLFFSHTAKSDNPFENKGTVTYVEGSVKKQQFEEIPWSSVQENSNVSSGERVRTFQESRAELDMAKLDKIRMAPKTIIDILKLYEETKENVIESKIQLKSGDLWANIAKKPDQVKFSIETPVALTAITGTTLRLNVDSDSSTMVKVYTGEVVVTNAPESSLTPTPIQPREVEGPREIPGPREVSLEEWSVIVRSMQQIHVNPKGNVIFQGNFTSTDQDEQSDWVKWNLQRDQKTE